MKFYRTVFTYEVLSNELSNPGQLRVASLTDIHHEVTEGHSSGMFLGVDVREVSFKEMVGLLVRQGSDPDFLSEEAE